jgi:hypothetical protein
MTLADVAVGEDELGEVAVTVRQKPAVTTATNVT